MAKRKTSEKYFKIIEAATRIFARKGFYSARVSEIAREAGVADGTIYIYFDNKDDILISLFEEQMQVVLDNMIDQLRSEPDAARKLRRFALTHLRLIRENPDMAEIIQVELRRSGRFMKEYENRQFASYLDLIGEIVQQGQEQGLFRREIVPGVAKRAFFGALDEMSRYWVLSSRKHYDIETAADQISSCFLDGLKAA